MEDGTSHIAQRGAVVLWILILISPSFAHSIRFWSLLRYKYSGSPSAMDVINQIIKIDCYFRRIVSLDSGGGGKVKIEFHSCKLSRINPR